MYTLSSAAKATGVAKSTIYEAIKAGRLLARKLDTGNYAIDLAELRRVFPSAQPVAAGAGAATTEHKGFIFPVWDVG
jgi:excisionase family DNA binding protein